MSKSKQTTIYVLYEDFNPGGPLKFQLEALPATVTEKMVRVARYPASRWRIQLNVSECHFTAEDAIRAKEKQAEELERKAAEIRSALAALKKGA